MRKVKSLKSCMVALAAVMALALPALFTGGCSTTSTVTVGANGVSTTNTVTTLNVAATTNAINATVPIIVKLAVAKYPQAKQYLTDAAAGILLFTATSANYSPAALNAAITAATVNDPLDPGILTGIDAGVALYEAYYGDAVLAKLATPAWLLPVLQSLATSVEQGIASQ